MRRADRAERKATPAVATPERTGAAPARTSVGSILDLQRLAGNHATVAMLSQVQRKVAKSTVPGTGPIADIPNTSLSKDDKAIADKAATAVKAGGASPWPRMNKWGEYHANYEGKLPGKKGAGGYKEYYLPKWISENSPASGTNRLVAGQGQIFHTADHYVTFTHLGAL